MLEFFKLKERNTTISREIIGGITTFLTMVYVLALVPSILKETGQISFGAAFSGVAIATAVATFDKEGKMPKLKEALLSDATGTCVGACFGAPTITCYIESGAGVAAGAKTGLASVVTGILFLLALFLAPLFALVPHFAITGALVLVGFLMMKSVAKIDFSDASKGIPAFITIIVMPFAYGIVAGIAWGVIVYTLCVNALVESLSKSH